MGSVGAVFQPSRMLVIVPCFMHIAIQVKALGLAHVLELWLELSLQMCFL